MRSAYGKTPNDFVADLRLEHAASLLAATSEPVAAIASRCGFASQSYFTVLLSRTLALTPRLPPARLRPIKAVRPFTTRMMEAVPWCDGHSVRADPHLVWFFRDVAVHMVFDHDHVHSNEAVGVQRVDPLDPLTRVDVD
jgi:AraC-like DNA-binding protein